MRALGIPNNKNFFEVTQIKDALELWSSIQARARATMPRARAALSWLVQNLGLCEDWWHGRALACRHMSCGLVTYQLGQEY